MPKKPDPICRNCWFAEWQKTETGRIRPQVPGHCTWMPERRPLPMCVEPGLMRRERIWRDNNKACPTFEKKRRKTNAT